MKKCCLFFILLICWMNVSNAEIAEERVKLGGVGLGDSYKYVDSLHGKPKESWVGKGKYLGVETSVVHGVYSHRLHVFYLEKEATVIDVGTPSAYIKTADGISAGSHIDDVIKTYGEPDTSRYAYGGKLLGYRCCLSSGRNIIMEFDIRDSVVYQIEIHYISEEEEK